MTSFVSQPCLIGSPNIQQGLKFRKHQGIPGIEITSSGKLFATWYANNIAGEGPGNYAILAVSGDHGLSWKEVKTITPAAENVRVFDPVLWLAPNGILWWSWSQSFSQAIGDVYDGFAGVWVSCCNDIESDDLIWSAPRRIGHGIMMNKPTVMCDGSWVFPTAIWSCYPDKTPEELRTLNRSNFLISHDNGKSFKLLLGPEVPQRSFDEHLVIEKQDNQWWTLVRTKYGVGESFSSDSGKSWSLGVKSKIYGPDSRFVVRRLSSGNLLMINHQPEENIEDSAMPHPRSNLTAWLSYDDGKSWHGKLLLDSRRDVSYPDFVEGKDKFIYVIYDRKRIDFGEILLSRFTEMDIANGRMMTSGSFCSLLVSAFRETVLNEETL